MFSFKNLLAVVLLGVALFMVGCRIIRHSDGSIEVLPTPGETVPGYWRVTINGQCYFTNGTWCFPCTGGIAVKCASIFEIPQPQQRGEDGSPVAPLPLDQNDGVLLSSINDIANGDSSDALAKRLSLNNWRPGDSIRTGWQINLLDTERDLLDLTLVLPLQSRLPEPGIYEGGVLVELAWMGGDLTDHSIDPIAIRLVGPSHQVAKTLANFLISFKAEINTEFGVVEITGSDGVAFATLNGKPLAATAR